MGRRARAACTGELLDIVDKDNTVLRVRLIVRWPGKTSAGRMRNEIVHEMDLFTTIAAVSVERSRPSPRSTSIWIRKRSIRSSMAHSTHGSRNALASCSPTTRPC